jgi:hypothetical protein
MEKTNLKSLSVILFVIILSGLLGACRKEMTSSEIDALTFQLQNNNIPISVPDIQAFMNNHMLRTWGINGVIAERSPSSWPNLPWGGVS